MKEINICLATDDNYICHTAAVVASVLAHAKPTDRYHFYILSTDLSSKNKEKFDKLKKIKDCQIDYPNLDTSILDRFKIIKTHSHLNLQTFNRLLIPLLFPALDKMIYLDSDIIVLGDLAPLNDIDVSGYYFAGVKDATSEKLANSLGYPEKYAYINAGILVLNCAELRKCDYLTKILNVVGKIEIKLADQDLINYCFHEKIKLISYRWNMYHKFWFEEFHREQPKSKDYLESVQNPVIIHFVGPKKPWKIGVKHPYKKAYLHYLKQTPWAGKAYTLQLKEIGRKFLKHTSTKTDQFKKSTLHLCGLSLFSLRKTNRKKKLKILGLPVFVIKKIQKNNVYKIYTLFGIPFYFRKIVYTSCAQLPGNIRKVQKLKNKYKGKRCFIIGGAPSLNKLDLTKLNNEYTCTVGKGYKLAEKGLDHSTFHVFGDTFGYAESCLELDTQFSGTYFFKSSLDCVNPVDPLFFDTYERNTFPGSYGFQTDLTKPLYSGCTVILFALQIMAYLGFSKIYLIGVDLDFNTPQAHAYLSTKEEEKRTHYSIYNQQKMYDALKFAANFLKKRKQEVINASAVKKLPFLKEVHYEDLFK